LLLPLSIFAKSYGLREFIDHANKHNRLLKSSELKSKAKQKKIDDPADHYHGSIAAEYHWCHAGMGKFFYYPEVFGIFSR
jgi:hypothetical protein